MIYAFLVLFPVIFIYAVTTEAWILGKSSSVLQGTAFGKFRVRGRRTLKMVSVGGTVGGGGDETNKQRILIAPSTDSDEQMIIENFGQIQQGERKRIGIIGTQDLSDQHYQMIELLAYALVLSGNHIYTSGSAGNIENSLKTTNTAVIYGALRACSSELLTVILPQSLPRQPPEMQAVLMRVANLVEHPEYDDMGIQRCSGHLQ